MRQKGQRDSRARRCTSAGFAGDQHGREDATDRRREARPPSWRAASEGPRCQCVNTRDLTPRCRAQTTRTRGTSPSGRTSRRDGRRPRRRAAMRRRPLTRCGGAPRRPRCPRRRTALTAGWSARGSAWAGAARGSCTHRHATRCSGVCVDPEERGRTTAARVVAGLRECCVAGACAVPAGVSVGASHSCVRYSDGRVFCWGTTGLGVLTAPLASGSSAHRPCPKSSRSGRPGRPSWCSSSSRLGAANCGIGSTGAVTCWGEFRAFGGRPGIAPASRTRATSRSTPSTTSARRKADGPGAMLDGDRRGGRRRRAHGRHPRRRGRALRLRDPGRSDALVLGRETRPGGSATGPGPCAPPPVAVSGLAGVAEVATRAPPTPRHGASPAAASGAGAGHSCARGSAAGGCSAGARTGAARLGRGQRRSRPRRSSRRRARRPRAPRR